MNNATEPTAPCSHAGAIRDRYSPSRAVPISTSKAVMAEPTNTSRQRMRTSGKHAVDHRAQQRQHDQRNADLLHDAKRCISVLGVHEARHDTAHTRHQRLQAEQRQ